MNATPQFQVGIFMELPEITDYPMYKPEYQHSYFELTQEIALRGGQGIIVRGQASYLGNGTFTRGWIMHSTTDYELIERPHVDVVFDKGEFVGDGLVPVFNDPELSEICTNKFLMYQLFKKYCPVTILVNERSEYAPAIAAMTTEKVVVKPVDGEEGKGVVIDVPTKLLELQPELPVIVQEFLDTSAGVPGIVDGTHDLRAAIFDGEIMYSYVRTPPPGSLTANVARGGTFRMVEPAELPAEVQAMAAEIDTSFKHLSHRFYGIDFGVTPQGPRIIEMNSRLGLLPNADAPVFHTLKQKLAAVFADLAQQPPQR